MKRLVLRIAALGTVVVLGLIAIAQAQRGVRDDSRADGHNTSTAAESSHNPLREAADSPSRPALASAVPNESDNPLRGRPVESKRYEEPGLNRLDLDNNHATVVQASATSPVEAAPPLSPFASRGGVPAGVRMAQPLNPPANTGGFPDASAAGLAATDSDVPPVAVEDRPDRYASHTSEPAVVSVGDAREPVSAYSSDNRYSAATPPSRTGSSAGESEPGRFHADPFAPPTGISSSRTSDAGNRAAVGSADINRGEMTASPLDRPSGGPTLGGSALAMGGSTIDRSALDNSAALSGEQGTGQPGNKQLEGPQSPRISIQKIAPAEIQVGKQATFKLAVVNTGETPAAGVEVHDQIPKGTRLVGTTPRARAVKGELVWNLGTIAPGDEATVEMQVMPMTEGEIGSVATVHFSAAASARTTATRPQLVLKTSAPGRVLIGEEVSLSITISNPGSGTATGVVLSEQIPAGLRHASGSDLEYEVGDLKPGDTKKLELTLTAARAGKITNVLSARGTGNLRAEDHATIEVLAPELDIAVKGSKRRYLEREATYELSVANPGTAAAEGVELVAYLPSGLKFISANNAGYYEETDRSIRWRLQKLPTGETGNVQLVAMPVEEGQHKLRLKGTAEKGLEVEKEQPISVEGITAIMFEAVDIQDPIEVGGETTYEIRVLNQGSKAATNVQVAVMLPQEMQAVAAEGPTRHVVDGSRILFDGLSRLAPKADITYRVRVKGLKPGDLRASVKVKTNEMQTPVTKEESTRVYAE